ncbi:MAG: hypothetical protein JSR93_01585 [Verrucomicrobia bacterium]|nr:hypothetical protein [Verrucomicrobiota bacterium]
MSVRLAANYPTKHVQFDNVSATVLTPAAIGEKLLGITRNEIIEIYDKMKTIISDRLILNSNPILQGGYIEVREHPYGQKERTAKEILLGCLPMELNMINDFGQGGRSKLAEGRSLEYSYEGMLAYAAIASGLNDALHQALGAELATKSDYRIRLDLDREQMRTQSGLVFRIIETNGQEELSRTSFTLR